jgi:hypothetical protein
MMHSRVAAMLRASIATVIMLIMLGQSFVMVSAVATAHSQTPAAPREV